MGAEFSRQKEAGEMLGLPWFSVVVLAWFGSYSSWGVNSESENTLLPISSGSGVHEKAFNQNQESTSEINWRLRRLETEALFLKDLDQVVQWCQQNGLDRQVVETKKLAINRDPGRQYITLPSEDSMPTALPNVSDEFNLWLDKINRVKVDHGERLFELAKDAADRDAGAMAFQFLHDVLFYDRDHRQARKVLGHKKVDGGWRVASDRMRSVPSRRDHDIVNWKAKSFILVSTPHFKIESNASEERTRYLAEQLEQSYQVWRQVFFEYWSSPGTVKRWLAGNGTLRSSSRKFRIIFFVDRNEYLKQLSPLVRGIEVSRGYYSKDQKCSFFYDGEESTWRHELTHQLFREAGGARGESLESSFVWLDEGIATYFESLVDHGHYVTLGGFDASRLQFSRIRRILEGAYIPIKELSSLGRTELQRRSDLVQIYTQASGLTHMLMNDVEGIHQQNLVQFFRLMYKGRIKKGAFEKVLGKTFDEWDQRYPKYLQVESDSVAKYLSDFKARTELSLPGAKLKQDAFDAIAKCNNLKWLDLSSNSISKSNLESLTQCRQLQQLFLTSCTFGSEALSRIGDFPILDDLNLSGSSISDADLVYLGGLKSLRTLHLSSTRITDEGIKNLAKLKGLVFIDLTNTSASQAAIGWLKTQLPNTSITP